MVCEEIVREKDYEPRSEVLLLVLIRLQRTVSLGSGLEVFLG